MGSTMCTSVALGFKGTEWGSNLGPVANNGKNIAKFGDAASEFSTLREATEPLSMSAIKACLWPTRCTPVALGFKGSEWGSNLGCQDSEMQYLGEKVWGCGLGIFDLVECNRPPEYVGNGRLSMAYQVYPLSLFLGRSQSVIQVQYLIS